MSKSHQIIKDNLKAGTWLNGKLSWYAYDYDYTKFDCYYIGDPISFAFCYGSFVKLEKGWQAEISVASDRHVFKKSELKEMFAIFFNSHYNAHRLVALISPDNEQAIKMANLCGLTFEGRLRQIDGENDKLLFSLLKHEYEEKWAE